MISLRIPFKSSSFSLGIAFLNFASFRSVSKPEYKAEAAAAFVGILERVSRQRQRLRVLKENLECRAQSSVPRSASVEREGAAVETFENFFGTIERLWKQSPPIGVFSFHG